MALYRSNHMPDQLQFHRYYSFSCWPLVWFFTQPFLAFRYCHSMCLCVCQCLGWVHKTWVQLHVQILCSRLEYNMYKYEYCKNVSLSRSNLQPVIRLEIIPMRLLGTHLDWVGGITPILSAVWYKTNLVAEILATKFSVLFVIYVMFSRICSIWV